MTVSQLSTFRSAAVPVRDNAELEQYRQALLACAQGRDVPPDYLLDELGESSGRSSRTFAATLKQARQRYLWSEQPNQKIAQLDLRRNANPQIKAELDRLHAESTELRAAIDQAEADIKRHERTKAKLPLWREQIAVVATGGLLHKGHAGWPEWLYGQEPSSKTAIGYNDILMSLVDDFFAAKEKQIAEIPRLEEMIRGNQARDRQIWIRIETLRNRLLDWKEFLF